MAVWTRSDKPITKLLARHTPRLLIIAGVCLIIAGAIIGLHQYHQNAGAIQQARSNPAAPSTVKPTANDFDSYTVLADLPRYIFISKINVKAIVRSVGLTKAGAIGSPNNIYNTAWYRGSSKPGQPGATLIDGHVSSWNAKGVFYDLKLKPGDNIQIERGNGTKINYTVVRSQTYDTTSLDSAVLLQPIISSKSGLNLITCTGDIIKGTNEFDKRIIVFASQE